MRIKRRKENKANLAKLVTGVLAGGVIGATLGWLTAPAAGSETRRQFQRRVMNARDRAKTAAGNIESRARELAEEVSNVESLGEKATAQRRQATIVHG